MIKWLNCIKFLNTTKSKKFQLSILSLYREQHTDGDSVNAVQIAILTEQEKSIVLDTINGADESKLKRLKLSNTRINKILEYREKNGLFISTDQIAMIKGFRPEIVDKLCKIILFPNNDKGNSNNTKIRGNLLSPILINSESLKSAVGINVTPNYVSWSKLEKDNCCLTEWDMFDISCTASKKFQLNDIFLVVNELANKIPYADVYVFEATQQMSNLAQKQLMTILVQQKILQLISMLLVLLNSSPIHNPNFVKLRETKVHFLRSQLSARLFKTLIGSERVSGNETILNILNGCNDDRIKKLNALDHLKSQYDVYPGVEKDILGQSLLLNLTFMNLCVYKTPQSIKALLNRVKSGE